MRVGEHIKEISHFKVQRRQLNKEHRLADAAREQKEGRSDPELEASQPFGSRSGESESSTETGSQKAPPAAPLSPPEEGEEEEAPAAAPHSGSSDSGGEQNPKPAQGAAAKVRPKSTLIRRPTRRPTE
jgi:hypothetical protein